MRFLSVILLSFLTSFAVITGAKPTRVLVVTGGHSYNKETFDEMLNSLGPGFTFQVVEFPSAFEMFNTENRGKYDLLLFYHMWQKITPDQQKVFADCIKSGKPVVALHHSICAFDDWEEYWHILGGKYFHKPTVVGGKEYAACSYIHDIHFTANITGNKHPVTKGAKDFELFDETYKGYYVEDGVTPLITTTEPSSTPIIGWTKKYGKARIVVLQSGHDTPTFQNPSFRLLLKQAIKFAGQ
jgi:type 1 glutamine amidotransferase